MTTTTTTTTEETKMTTEEPDMTEKIIENATLRDVRPGDHLVWEWSRQEGDRLVVTRVEGTAHRPGEGGDWCTEYGRWITNGMNNATLTIHRPVKELPTEPGAIIVPADGREYIEATTDSGTYHAREAVLRADRFWAAAWRTDGRRQALFVESDHITPDTWKVEEEA